MDSTERFEKDVASHIDKHADRLQLSDSIVNMAQELFHQHNNESVAYSRPDEMFAVASIYLAHKVLGKPISTSQIVGGTDLPKRQFLMASKSMQRDLASKGYEIQILGFEQFLQKFANELDLSDETVERAREIYEQTEHLMQNYTGQAKAAASLYYACQDTDDRVTQLEMSKVAGITEVTVRNRYREQREELES